LSGGDVVTAAGILEAEATYYAKGGSYKVAPYDGPIPA
jgi:hypothetical protein